MLVIDRPPHHLSWPITKAAEEVEDHTSVVRVRVSNTRPLCVVASLQITGVDILLPEVRIRLAGVAGRATVFVDDTLHSVKKPPGERKRRDNAPGLILRVIIGVVAVRGVMSVGHDAVPDDQQARPYSHKYVVVDIFNHIVLVQMARREKHPFEGVSGIVLREYSDRLDIEKPTEVLNVRP